MAYKINDLKVSSINPLNLREKDRLIIFARNIQDYTTDPSISIWKNIFITRSGIGMKNFSLLKITIPHYNGKRKHFWRYAFLQFFLRKKRALKGNHFFIHNHWCPGYYHWITEALPRLIRSLDFIKERNLILPESFSGYPFESLSPFTLGIEWIKQRENIRVENLLIPENTHFTARYDKESILKIRSIYQSYLVRNKLDKLNLGERIYISRKSANQRIITNEKELVDVLKLDGFTIVEFEEFSFWEQVSIMCNAKYLVSIHGAGLTNQVFMKPGGYIFELQKEVYKNENFSNCYLKLSNVLGHNYLYQFCKPTNISADIYSADLIVDMYLFKKNINLITTQS